jgi:hypothetical protein
MTMESPEKFRSRAAAARLHAAASVDHDMRATWEAIAEQFEYLAALSERLAPWRDGAGSTGGMSCREPASCERPLKKRGVARRRVATGKSLAAPQRG